MPYLVLVADRDRTVLDTPTIDRVREAARASPATVLAPGEAAWFACDDPDAGAAALGLAPVDALTLPHPPRPARLLVADMDSTIVTGETLDELAAFAGFGAAVAAITMRSMNGEIDFADALRERVALLRGLKLDALERTWEGVRMTQGAAELVGTMRAAGARTALVSGGFTFFTDRVARALGFDVHRANVLIDDGRALTGAVGEPVLDRDAKLRTLRALAAEGGFTEADALAVGDGANDLAMIGAAGLGVAFHAKPVVAAAARLHVRHAGLRALLFLQGFHADRFRAAGPEVAGPGAA